MKFPTLTVERGRFQTSTPVKKIILDLCGGTGSWGRPYVNAGYDVRLCTLPDCDVRTYQPPENVHGVLAAPPCTEFSKAKQFHGEGNYVHDYASGLEPVVAVLRIIAKTHPKWWVIENPDGYLRRWMGEPDAVFEPWYYGDNYQKTTLLWGNFVMPEPTAKCKPPGLKKFSLLKSHEIAPEHFGAYDRTTRRSITPSGFAEAFFKSNP